MKVGTDGVLLACMVPRSQKNNILDIGCGSGVIALILAQNNPLANIYAVEIDQDSYLQSVENFKASPWSKRLTALHSSIQDFAQQTLQTFNTIVCNPPFFQNDESLREGARKTARQEFSLNFNELAMTIGKLLDPSGSFHCILPTSRISEMRSALEKNKIYLQKKFNIKGKKHLETKRTILHCSRVFKVDIKEENIVIYNENGTYTEQYKELTKDFYLKF